MRLSTRTKTTFAVATAISMVGTVAWAQNLKVMGTTTGEGNAYFNRSLSVTGPITMTNPDSTNINALSLARTNENGRSHRWSWWHMNTAYGQDSLQLYEYQTDSAGLNCTGNALDGAMCSPRLTIAKGGNVGIGVPGAAYRLDVNGDVHATGWVRTEGATGWYSQTYDGGWYMSDYGWIRSHNSKSVWMGNGLLGSDGGLTVGFGGASPPAGGAIINGNVGIGAAPASKLSVTTLNENDGIRLSGNSVLWSGLYTNLAAGAYNGTTAAGDRGIFYGGSTPGAPGGGFVIAPWANGPSGLRLDPAGNLQVNGNLQASGRIRATQGTLVYRTHSSCNTPPAGILTTEGTCKYVNQFIVYTYSNSVVGRLIDN